MLMPVVRGMGWFRRAWAVRPMIVRLYHGADAPPPPAWRRRRQKPPTSPRGSRKPPPPGGATPARGPREPPKMQPPPAVLLAYLEPEGTASTPQAMNPFLIVLLTIVGLVV